MESTASHDFGSYSLSLDQNSCEQSFALQYTSLILILLTFIVGTFVRPHIGKPATESEVLVKKDKVISSIAYKDLFSESSSELNSEVILALLSVLKNHDLNYEIKVYGGNSNLDRDHRIEQALSRSVTLQRYFLSENIPLQYSEVLALDEPKEIQAEVKILKVAEVEG